MRLITVCRAFACMTMCVVAAAACPPAMIAQTPSCSAAAGAPPVLPAIIPFELKNNHVVIHVCRGETPLTFTLDTGAGSSIFDLETAKSLGIGIGNAFRAGGAGNGTIAAAQITRDSVLLPGAPIVVPIGIAMDFSSLNRGTGNTLQGIIGADFMNRYVVALDYRNHQMRLFDRKDFHYTGTGTTVPFRVIGAFIRVNAEIVLADGAHLPLDAVVDVGSSQSLAVGKPFAQENNLRQRIGPTIHRPGGRGVGGVTDVDVGRVETLKVGDVSFNRPITQLHYDSAGVFSNRVNGDANIGGDILRRYTVYIDYGAHQLVFEPHDGTNEPFEADMSGLVLGPPDEREGLKVEYVVANSPASEAGLVRGDIVVMVDSEPAQLPMLDALRKRLYRENQNVAFTVRRKGAEVVLHLKTRRIV